MVKVSVVMITYNHEMYIKEAIHGILAQKTNFEIELIVADDCSTDKTESVVREIINTHPKSNIIKYTRHVTNKGMMPNFIWALEQCKREYIALCEGDDYWTDPNKLQKQVNFLEANPEYVLCFHSVKILEPDGSLVNDYLTKVLDNYETIETLAEHGNYIHTPSVVFKNIIKSFPDEMSQSPVGDYFLYMLLAQLGKFGKLDDVMGVYRHQIGIWSKLEVKVRRLKMLFTLLLIRSTFNENINFTREFDRQIKELFYALLPDLKIEDILYLRSNKVISEFVDSLLLEQINLLLEQINVLHEQINYYKQNQVSNTQSSTLLKIIVKRAIKKLMNLLHFCRQRVKS